MTFILTKAMCCGLRIKSFGLVKNWNTWSSVFFQPNGPSTPNVLNMSVSGGNLWVAPGELSTIWVGVGNHDGVFSFINGTWTTYNSSNTPIFTNDTLNDVVRVCVNPSNPSDAFAGTWSNGLMEFNNQTFTTLYNESNSTLSSIQGQVRIGGICFDLQGNMWVTNSGSKYGVEC